MKIVLWIAGGLLIALIAMFVLVAATSDTTKNTIAKKELSAEQVRTSATEVTYEQLMRNAEDWEGKPVKFDGKVIQAGDGFLKVNFDTKNYSSDDVYVGYDHQNHILKDDIVTVFGIASGRATLKMVIGAQVTVPRVIATTVTVN